MPSGRTHIRIDLLMLVVLMGAVGFFWSFLTAYFGRDEMVEYIGVFVLTYLFSSFLLSPDMDLKNSDSMKNWGVLRHLWRAYANGFRQRGLSHVPILGTLTRLVYILLLVYAIFEAANAVFDMGWGLSVKSLENVDRLSIVFGLCGLFLPDLYHTLADRLSRHAR